MNNTLFLMLALFLLFSVPFIHAQKPDKSTGWEKKLEKIPYIFEKVKTSDISVEIFATEYIAGEQATIWLQLLRNYQPINNATCFIDAYYPNKSILFNNMIINHLSGSDGLYYYDLTAPSEVGVYMLSAECHTPQIAYTDDFLDYSGLEAHENITISGGKVSLTYLVDNCSGTCTPCSSFTNSSSCLAQSGCNWTGIRGFFSTLTQSDFDEGTYNYTFYNSSGGFVTIYTGYPFPDNQQDGWANMTGNVLLYHFDNNSAYGENDTYVYDFSGNGNNGTVTGNVTPTPYGRFDGGFNFGGSSADYIVKENTQSLNITGNITISAWLKATNFSSSWDYILYYRDTYTIEFGLYNGKPESKVKDETGYTFSVRDDTSIDLNQWYHIIFVRNDSSLWLYLNGELIDSRNDFVGNLMGGATIRVGHHFNGTIDELAVWNRSLTYTEILKIFENQSLTHGDYTSKIFDSGYNVTWHNISWFVNYYNESGELSIRVNNDRDDAEEYEDGTVKRYSSDLEIVYDSSVPTNQTIGMRFVNVTIPRGSKITGAYIQFTADSNPKNIGTPNFSFYAQDSDDSPEFGSNSYNITNRDITTSVVTWTNVPLWTGGSDGVNESTPDLSPIIQEVINRNGWKRGNSIVIIINGTGGTTRNAESYDGNPSSAPLLLINYTYVPLNLTVRSCDDANCSGENFTDINDSSPQNLSVLDNRYFQYKFYFNKNGNYTPELYNVSVYYSSLGCSGTCTPCSSFTNSSSCLAQSECNWTFGITQGYIQSIPVTLTGTQWANYSAEYDLKQGNISFSILNQSNNTLCTYLGVITGCADSVTPIKMYAMLTKPNSSATSPEIDRWYIISENVTIEDSIRGSGEMHISNLSQYVVSNITTNLEDLIALMFALHSTPITTQYCEDNTTLVLQKSANWTIKGKNYPINKTERMLCQYGCFNNECRMPTTYVYVWVLIIIFVIMFLYWVYSRYG